MNKVVVSCQNPLSSMTDSDDRVLTDLSDSLTDEGIFDEGCHFVFPSQAEAGLGNRAPARIVGMPINKMPRFFGSVGAKLCTSSEASPFHSSPIPSAVSTALQSSSLVNTQQGHCLKSLLNKPLNNDGRYSLGLKDVKSMQKASAQIIRNRPILKLPAQSANKNIEECPEPSSEELKNNKDQQKRVTFSKNIMVFKYKSPHP